MQGRNGAERPLKRLLTLREAAEYLSLSPWTLRKRIWAGVLPSVKISRLVLVDRVDLDAYVEANKVQEQPYG